ncbi:hypothetical protein FWP50_24905, partial [Vibrio parahaemolyticus]|nr:hypothetical protein [Vibrio parahaemolyticus]
MMNDNKSLKNKQLSDEKKLRQAIDFVEELSWLLESKNKLRLSEIPDILRDASKYQKKSVTNESFNSTEKYVSPNPNVHYLIGVLPSLFLDTDIFPKNDDIIKFANEALKIYSINSNANRSRFEIIGHIVCKCTELDDGDLNMLVSALSYILGDKDNIKQVAKEKQSTGFSWNETIRKLA